MGGLGTDASGRWSCWGWCRSRGRVCGCGWCGGAGACVWCCMGAWAGGGGGAARCVPSSVVVASSCMGADAVR